MIAYLLALALLVQPAPMRRVTQSAIYGQAFLWISGDTVCASMSESPRQGGWVVYYFTVEARGSRSEWQAFPSRAAAEAFADARCHGTTAWHSE